MAVQIVPSSFSRHPGSPMSLTKPLCSHLRPREVAPLSSWEPAVRRGGSAHRRADSLQVRAAAPQPQAPAIKPSATAQRAALWAQIQASEHAQLADLNSGSGYDFSIYNSAQEHVAIRDPLNNLLSAVVSLQGFAALAVYPGFARAGGMLGALAAPLALAALAAPKLFEILSRKPHATTAQVRLQPLPNHPYGGLFAQGAPALITLTESRLGPSIRLQVFVDGREPIILESHLRDNARAASCLAQTCPNGRPIYGPVPENLSLDIMRAFECPDGKDFRQVAQRLSPGDTVGYVTESYSKKWPDGTTEHGNTWLGRLVAESRFVASRYADEHI